MKTPRAWSRCSCGNFELLAFVLSLFSLTASISAQAAGTSQPRQRLIRNHTRANPGDHVKGMAKYLELDQKQRMALQKILEQRQQEVLQMRFAPLPAGSIQIDRFRAIQDRTVERIRAVLNEEQRKKYDLLTVRRLTPPQTVNVEDWLKAASTR